MQTYYFSFRTLVKEDYQNTTLHFPLSLCHGHKGLNSMKVFDKYVFAISKILPSLDFKSLGLGDVARWLDTGMLAVHVYKSTGHFLSLKCSRIWKEIWVTYRMQRISGMVKSINSLHKTFCLLASRLLPVFSELKRQISLESLCSSLLNLSVASKMFWKTNELIWQLILEAKM